MAKGETCRDQDHICGSVQYVLRKPGQVIFRIVDINSLLCPSVSIADLNIPSGASSVEAASRLENKIT